MAILARRKKAAPYQPTRLQPEHAGAYLFTLRSVPRHHDGIRAAIDGQPGARCWFSEPLAYIRGQGVAIFRIEAGDFRFLHDLYAFWAETERREAFTFDIKLYFNNNDFVTSLRGRSPDEVRRIIEEGAPRVPADPASINLTPTSHNL